MKTVEDKRTREKLLVSQMIALYCRIVSRVACVRRAGNWMSMQK